MRSILILGLLIGMRHALEADHLAAVASLSTVSGGRVSTIMRGVTWGLGHTIALLVIGGASLWLGLTIPDGPWFDRVVGVMLVVLGANVLVRLRRERIHVHLHRHADGAVHVHAHRHAPGESHDALRHRHAHGRGFDLKTIAVGMVHGVAGSAALMLVVASAIRSRWLGLAYIALFGVGSIAGMGVLSAVIAVPLALSSRRASHALTALEITIAIGTMAIGAAMMR